MDPDRKPDEPQLSPEAGVSTEVASLAMDRGTMLAPLPAAPESAFTDADRMVRNPGVAEELAQEAFLRVYRSRETYQAAAKFSTWLYRIAMNLAVNYARDTRHERPEQSVSLEEPDPETGLVLELPDTAPTVEQNLLERERLAAIRKHVEALPERQK